MKQSSANRLVFTLVLIVIIIGISAFRQKPKTHRYSFRQEIAPSGDDTPTPRKHLRYLTDKDEGKLDEAMKKLDAQMLQLDEQMKKIDFSKVEKQARDAVKNVDFNKINKQVEESLKKVDFEKINRDMKESIAKLETVNMDKVKTQIEKVKSQLEKEKYATNLNQQKTAEIVQKAMKNVQQSMAHAKESMQKAKAALENLKGFTDALEKDGLIDKSKPYKIEVKNGELYINGNKEPKEISDKYKRYYKKDDFSINSDEDGEPI